MEIIPLLDNFVIDNYNDNKELNTGELRRIYDYVEGHPDIKARVRFDFRLQHQVLTSRGGQAPNKKGMNDTDAVNVLCSQPFRQMVVRPTGEVSLCCNDALGMCTLGDVRTQTLAEIWNSEKYQALRNEMLTNGRRNLPLCKDCDSMFTFEASTGQRMRP